MPDRSRKNIFLIGVYLSFCLIAVRLFYWQIIKGEELRDLTEIQAIRKKKSNGLRGQIFTSDAYLLVGNQKVFDLKLDRRAFEGNREDLSEEIAEIVAVENWRYQDASGSAAKEVIVEEMAGDILAKFDARGNWPNLAVNLSEETRIEIEALENSYLHFDEKFERFYPEASMAAHLTGFVGRDEDAMPVGRYGIEGFLEDELRARHESRFFKTDALGLLLAGEDYAPKNLDGRDVTLTIRRDLQNLAEENLKWGIEKYGAERGEILILESHSGKILAMATWPNYQQWQYFKYPGEILKNPSLTRLYEPGSTFKVLTVAAGIDSGKITPETPCTNCAGPRNVYGSVIRTWNDEYQPNINMIEALAKSDNTAMIFITDLLGKDLFVDYLKKFKIGEKIKIDLQDDAYTPFPQKIGPVETATISFGQGISTNSLQLIRAVNSIANDGVMLEPQIVEKVYDHQTNQEILTQIEEGETVISKESAETVTEMMIESAAHGEAQWIASEKYHVAAKTGTSQIPDPNGGYKEDETLASFIGFAPATNPQFTMLVKLENPQSSPWAAETAAPLWYRVADKLMILLNIAPDK